MDPTEPKPHNGDICDILSSVHHESVSAQVEVANYELALHQFDTDAVQELGDAYTDKVNDLIGARHLEEFSVVSGHAYFPNADDSLAPDPIFLQNEELVYQGAVVQTLNGRPQIFLEFYDETEEVDEEGEPILIQYFMIPDHITKLEIHPSETLLDLIHRSTEAAQAQIKSDDFLQSSVADQHAVLDGITNDFNLNLLMDDASEVVIYYIDAQYYMGQYPDLPMSLLDSRFYPDSVKDEESAGTTRVSGRHVDTVYAELIEDPHKHFQSVADFYLGEGAPCLLLDDKTRQAVYVVPVAAIRDIVVSGDQSIED